MIKYHKINAVVCLSALEDIPLIRDGKADVKAMISFHSDIKMLKKFIRSYELSESKEECIKYIDWWNEFIALRNAEDFIQHIDSKNRVIYNEMF